MYIKKVVVWIGRPRIYHFILCKLVIIIFLMLSGIIVLRSEWTIQCPEQRNNTRGQGGHLPGHQVHHAHSSHPHLHPPHHGHSHPLRILQCYQTVASSQITGATTRFGLININWFFTICYMQLNLRQLKNLLFCPPPSQAKLEQKLNYFDELPSATKTWFFHQMVINC